MLGGLETGKVQQVDALPPALQGPPEEGAEHQAGGDRHLCGGCDSQGQGRPAGRPRTAPQAHHMDVRRPGGRLVHPSSHTRGQPARKADLHAAAEAVRHGHGSACRRRAREPTCPVAVRRAAMSAAAWTHRVACRARMLELCGVPVACACGAACGLSCGGARALAASRAIPPPGGAPGGASSAEQPVQAGRPGC